jgi:hypothetical protein
MNFVALKMLTADRGKYFGLIFAIAFASLLLANQISIFIGILTRGESSLARVRENSLAAYEGGVVSLIEVLDADSNLLQVRDAKAQAQTEAARTAIASFRALGGGWDARHARSNGLYSDISTTDRR